MSLYFYGSILEQPTGQTFPKSVSVSQGEITNCVPNAGHHSVTAPVLSPQNPRRGGFNPNYDPYSPDWSFDFGGGPGGTTVNIPRGVASAETTDLHKTFSGAIQKLLPTSGAQAFGLAKGFAFARTTLPFAAASVPYARPSRRYPQVSVFKQAQVTGFVRAVAKILFWAPSPWSTAFSQAFGGFAPSMATSVMLSRPRVWAQSLQPSAQQSSLSRSKILATAFGRPWSPDFSLDFGPAGLAANLLTAYTAAGGGRTYHINWPSVAAIRPMTGRLVAVLSGEAIGQSHSRPLHVGATQTETTPTPHMVLAFRRALGVASATAFVVVRQIGTLHGLGSVRALGILWLVGRAYSATSTEVAHIVRQAGRLPAVIAASAMALVRQANLPRNIAAGALIVAYARAVLLFNLPPVSSASLFGLGVQHIIPKAVAALSTEFPVIHVLPTKTFPKAVAVLQAQASGIGRAAQRSVGASLAAIESLARAIGHLSGAASASVAARTGAALGVVRGLAGTIAAKVEASYTRVLLAASPSVVVLGIIRGIARGAAIAQLAARQIALTRQIAAASPSPVGLARFVAKTIAGLVPAQAAVIRGFYRRPAATEPNSPLINVSRGAAIAAVGSASLAALGRFISRSFGLVDQQSAFQGRGGVRLINVNQPNVASSAHPRGSIVRTVSAQVATFVRWFLPYIPQWAYQQTVILPFAGGPPEPPSFGPFDPSDRCLFGFDWSQRATPGDALIEAVVTSDPVGVPFSGPVFVSGYLVQIMVNPFTPRQLPATYMLRCTAYFASGRRSSFSVPFTVKSL